MSILSRFSQGADIRRAVEEKAHSYTPEWRFSENDPDGGTSLALVFADMFGETAERLDRVPYKYFLYFLNMLETKVRSVSPATGLAHFLLSENAQNSRHIPSGTQLYADVDSGEDTSTRVIFETANDIATMPAKLIKIFGVDPRCDVINMLETDKGTAKLFFADTANNLQVHRFSIWHSDVLDIRNPARISVRLDGALSRHDGGKNTTRLTDPDFATWSYVSNQIKEPVTRVYEEEGAILLELEGSRPASDIDPFAPSPPELQPHLVCDIHPGRIEAGIMTDGISVGSAYLHKEQSGIHIVPDHVYYNDIALRPQNPGYLFGKEPGRHDTLLICCDETFNKRGAQININFVMHTVIRETGSPPQGPVYNWDGRYVIEKAEGQIVTPDNMYISEIVWEYWNGVGWMNLNIDSENLNPFQGSEDVRHESIIFTCPNDMSGSYQNSIWGCWLRARITSVENPYSHYGRWQLPFSESISINYDYGKKLRSAQSVKTESNAESAVSSVGESTGTGLSLYTPLKYTEHAVYLAFDKPPSGLPVSIYIELEGTGRRSRTLSFEYLIKDASGELLFRPCKAIDGTDGLRDSGIISIFVPSDIVETSIFSTPAYWLRIVDADLRYQTGENVTVLSRVVINAVEIIQKQTVPTQYYDTELFDSGKKIMLPNRSVLDCKVFVNELGELDPSQAAEIPETIFEYDEDGGYRRAWIKWEVLPSLAGAGPKDRVVSLESATGVISFGDGVEGRVPPGGTRNIRVDYSFGGGSLGNIPAGRISGLVSGIDTVVSVTNFTSTGGGNDSENISTIERIGPARLRHRGRAVTLDDFENLVLEEFPEIESAKAFAGLDSNGQAARSFVTVVLLPRDGINRDQVLKICKAAYSFLAQRAHCEFISAQRLAVIPALMVTVNAIIEGVATDIMRAAATERAIVEAVARRIEGEAQQRIGHLPSVSDIFNSLRNIPNLANVNRVLLEGEYFENGTRVLIALDKPSDFPFACALSGTHIVRF
ncbi:MAG: hypothetical protein LBD23_09345 [Oscillospiraceae bacterium]|jgi:hypothetical protein|nr:hypothetical protein [Oscillospiraceae bacterium]